MSTARPELFRHTTYAMACAVDSNRGDRVLHLLQMGEPPDPPPNAGMFAYYMRSYLGEALRSNKRELVEILYAAGADVENAFASTINRVIVPRHHEEYWKVQFLLSNISVERLRAKQIDPLPLVMEAPELVDHFISAGFDPREVLCRDRYDQESLLAMAIRRACVDSALLLLERGADPFYVPSSYSRPQRRHSAAFELGKPNSLLDISCMCDALLRVTVALLHRGVYRLSVGNKHSLLTHAVITDAHATLYLLLDYAFPSEREAEALLLLAAEHKLYRTCRCLIQRGAALSVAAVQTKLPQLIRSVPECASLLLCSCTEELDDGTVKLLGCSAGAKTGEEVAAFATLKELANLRSEKLL